jgi:tellurite resistance protein TerC
MMTTGTPMMWTLFVVFVLVALLVDFFAMERQGAHKVSMKEAAIWSLIWVAVSFVFVSWLWWYLGGLDGNRLRTPSRSSSSPVTWSKRRRRSTTSSSS